MIVSSRLFDPVAVVNYVDYIESTGTQYIDTGITVTKDNLKTLKVVADVSILQTSDWSTSGANGPYFYFGVVQNGIFGFGTGDGFASTTINADTQRHIWIVDAKNGRFSMPNDDIDNPVEFSSTVNSSNNYIISGYSEGASRVPHKERIWSYQFYVDDVLTHDFRPCLDSEGEACLYDKVTKTYFHNAGTGSFTAG